MSFTDGFIVDAPACRGDVLLVAMTLPWMRSIPWTCVSEIAVYGENAPEALDHVRLFRGGDEVSIKACQSLAGYWTLGERVHLSIDLVTITPSPTLEVEVSFFIPYVDVGGHAPLIVARESVKWAAPLVGRQS